MRRLIFFISRFVNPEKFIFAFPFKWFGIVHKYLTGRNNIKNKFKSTRVGKSSFVHKSVQIFGADSVCIGNYSILSQDVWINSNRFSTEESSVVIGNNCYIGRRNYFSTSTIIKIMDYSFTGVDCHLLGCGHDFSDPKRTYIDAQITIGKPIVIGVNCWLTTSVSVLAGVTIGHGSIIGARSLVTKNIPPFSLAYGNPCQVIKRFSFKDNNWINVNDFTEDLENLIPSELEYLKMLQFNKPRHHLALLAAGNDFGWTR